jgi:hypothetical protein
MLRKRDWGRLKTKRKGLEPAEHYEKAAGGQQNTKRKGLETT